MYVPGRRVLGMDLHHVGVKILKYLCIAIIRIGPARCMGCDELQRDTVCRMGNASPFPHGFLMPVWIPVHPGGGT